MFGFLRSGLDEQSVCNAGLKRVCGGAFDGGFHSADRPAINEIFDRNRVGIRGQFPDWMRIFVGLNVSQRRDFDGREADLSIEKKHQHLRWRFRPGAAQHSRARRHPAFADLNIWRPKTVSVQVKAQSGECEDGNDEENVFLCHSQSEQTFTAVRMFEAKRSYSENILEEKYEIRDN